MLKIVFSLLKESLANSIILKYNFMEHEQLFTTLLFTQIVAEPMQSLREVMVLVGALVATTHRNLNHEPEMFGLLAQLKVPLEFVHNNYKILVAENLVADMVVSPVFNVDVPTTQRWMLCLR